MRDTTKHIGKYRTEHLILKGLFERTHTFYRTPRTTLIHLHLRRFWLTSHCAVRLALCTSTLNFSTPRQDLKKGRTTRFAHKNPRFSVLAVVFPCAGGERWQPSRQSPYKC